ESEDQFVRVVNSFNEELTAALKPLASKVAADCDLLARPDLLHRLSMAGIFLSAMEHPDDAAAVSEAIDLIAAQQQPVAPDDHCGWVEAEQRPPADEDAELVAHVKTALILALNKQAVAATANINFTALAEAAIIATRLKSDEG